MSPPDDVDGLRSLDEATDDAADPETLHALERFAGRFYDIHKAREAWVGMVTDRFQALGSRREWTAAESEAVEWIMQRQALEDMRRPD